MSRLKDMVKDKVFERSIHVSAYPVDENYIVIQGSLVDERLKEYYLISGEGRQAGKIHHMVIRLLIRISDMTIEDVEVEMIAVPREECYQMEKSLDVVKGLVLAHGFTSKVRTLLGGVKGCNHLVTLLTNMGPAAMQGIWTFKSQKPVDKEVLKNDKQRREKMSRSLINTCYVWREDGPTYKKLRDSIED